MIPHSAGWSRPAAAMLLAALVVVASAGAGTAHTRSMSWSTWRLDPDGGRIELRIKQLELTRQPPGHPWARTLPRQLSLRVEGRPCQAEPALRAAAAPEGWAIFRWTVRCDSSGSRSLESSLLEGVAASHTHFARVVAASEETGAPRERVLVTGRDGPWSIDAGEDGANASGFAAYVWLGTLHIATGWDHLAFVLALLLLAGSLRSVATLVTGFTVGHSLTLGLAVLGLVRPDSAAVEVLIGFSIALVAAENAWWISGRDRVIPALIGGALLLAALFAGLGAGALGPVSWIGLALFSLCHFGLLRGTTRPGALRAAIAFAFGLVHGFGFAGILMELELGASQLVRALFGFNVGVELGQLAIVLSVWPLLYVLARTRRSRHRQLTEVGSAAIFGLGLFWLVSRNF